jgi:ABC-type methionine transport system ATPase subunit
VTAARLHLTFPEHLLQEPVLYRLGREFDVVTNIRRANIDEHAGWVILEMDGPDDEVVRSVAWLTDQGIQVDRLEEDPPS